MSVTRQHAIFNLLKTKGSVTVAELQEKLGVSDMTIRRDLTALENEGLLMRVHGGAKVAETLSPDESTFQYRITQNRELKLGIVKFAVSIIKANDTIFLDGSTTCSELADILPEDMNITVFTNSLDVINKLRWKPGISVVSFGGQLAADGNTFDGIVAVENAERIRVDKCFFSGASFHTGGVHNAGIVGTAIKKQMLKNARMNCLLADSTKYNGSGVIELCKWSEVDEFITDSLLPDKERAIFQGLKIETHFIDVFPAKKDNKGA